MIEVMTCSFSATAAWILGITYSNPTWTNRPLNGIGISSLVILLILFFTQSFPEMFQKQLLAVSIGMMAGMVCGLAIRLYNKKDKPQNAE